MYMSEKKASSGSVFTPKYMLLIPKNTLRRYAPGMEPNNWLTKYNCRTNKEGYF